MNNTSLFIVTKSGIVIRPEAPALLASYVRYYIEDGTALLQVYDYHLCESQKEEELAKAMRVEIPRAKSVLADLERLEKVVSRFYELNFERLAEVFRKTRIQLGLSQIEDSPDVGLLLTFFMGMLKEENPTFRVEKFISYINEGRKEVIPYESARTVGSQTQTDHHDHVGSNCQDHQQPRLRRTE